MINFILSHSRPPSLRGSTVARTHTRRVQDPGPAGLRVPAAASAVPPQEPLARLLLLRRGRPPAAPSLAPPSPSAFAAAAAAASSASSATPPSSSAAAASAAAASAAARGSLRHEKRRQRRRRLCEMKCRRLKLFGRGTAPWRPGLGTTIERWPYLGRCPIRRSCSQRACGARSGPAPLKRRSPSLCLPCWGCIDLRASLGDL